MSDVSDVELTSMLSEFMRSTFLKKNKTYKSGLFFSLSHKTGGIYTITPLYQLHSDIQKIGHVSDTQKQNQWGICISISLTQKNNIIKIKDHSFKIG